MIMKNFESNFSKAKNKFVLTDDSDETPDEDPLDIWAYLNNNKSSSL